MSIAHLKDVDLYYEEFGSGDRYLIHAQQFINSHLYYTKDLAEKYGFHVFNVRIRGYAPSSMITEDFGDHYYDVWAQDICDFADAMGIDRFFYTGFSHGGGIGWHLCVNHPERVIAFFGVAAGPHKKDGAETGNARMLTIKASETRETWVAYAKEKAYQTGKVYKTLFNDPEVGEAAKAAWDQNEQFWMDMPKESACMNPRKPFATLKTEEELVAVLKTIKTPTLLFGGTRDSVSPPELIMRSCDAVEGSEAVIYSGCDHPDIPHAHRAEMVEEIVSFCKVRGLL